MMTKATQLAILNGALIKMTRLRTMTRDHFNAEGWDTETHCKAAAALYDEIIDMANTLRREAT
jgi:hypothetical protein